MDIEILIAVLFILPDEDGDPEDDQEGRDDAAEVVAGVHRHLRKRVGRGRSHRRGRQNGRRQDSLAILVSSS